MRGLDALLIGDAPNTYVAEESAPLDRTSISRTSSQPRPHPWIATTAPASPEESVNMDTYIFQRATYDAACIMIELLIITFLLEVLPLRAIVSCYACQVSLHTLAGVF